MRRTAVLLLLLLAACGSNSDNSRDGAGQPNPADLEVGLPAAPSAAQLEAQARSALAAVLLNANDARYLNVRPGSGGGVCGEVDSRQEDGRFSGPRPFVVTPEGAGVVSPTNRVVFGNPADIFPDFYIRWCATPEELAKLGTSIPEEEPDANAVAGNMLGAPDAASGAIAPELPPPLPAPVKVRPAEEPPTPAPKAPIPARNDDSFFSAVIRNQQ